MAVVPVDRFLAYLTDIGRSPNTVKANARDLKDYWSFIGFRGLDWRKARGAGFRRGGRSRMAGKGCAAGLLPGTGMPVRRRAAQGAARILGRYPSETVLFPQASKNPDGQVPAGSATYRLVLHRWLADCDIRDEHGRPVYLTPHQWRHTLGTALINRDVPQHVVQKILDHDSPLMTAHYARLSDKTVRKHWEKARKVDAVGQPVQISPYGPLGDAAWARQQLSRATQAPRTATASCPW
jgi:integrase-like protein